MGRKCCAPKCRSGYKGKSKDGISMHKFRAEWKSNFPRGDWKVTDQTFICSKHFTASDFITERRDSNTTRSTKKKDTELKYRFLKDDAYPTIYPNCPQYLSQKKLASRPSLGSTAAREFTIAKREEEKKALELEKDSVKSINDVKDKLRVQEYINSPSMKNASIKIETSQVVFYELDARDIKPSVKYCVIIYEDMTYRKLFLLFDSVHIFKCLYNNFQWQVLFECPTFDGMDISANFHHISELYDMELSKPIKMAYTLNRECLNPQPIEKTKVSLATRVFGEPTRNAMSFYVKKCFPQWQETLNFLHHISRWWRLLNVKSLSKGTRKRDPDSYGNQNDT